jgi:hypothetical protein
MGSRGRLVAVGILSTGENIEVVRQRAWDGRRDRQRATETPEVEARRYKAHKDEQRSLRAESRALRERYGAAVR